MAAAALGVTAITYLANHLLSNGQATNQVRIVLTSTRPIDRGLLYTAGTLGTALAAFCLSSWITERHPHSPVSNPHRHSDHSLGLIIVLMNLRTSWERAARTSRRTAQKLAPMP